MNLPLLKQSWQLALRHVLILGAAMVACGFLNDAIMGLAGTNHTQQAEIYAQLQMGGGVQNLAAINSTIGTSQDPADSLVAIGLLMLAASLELVVLLGLTDTLARGDRLSLAMQLGFFRQGLSGSLKGFWRGFLRFLLFCLALSVGILLLMLRDANDSLVSTLAIAGATFAIFVWMMVFLLPYIFATIACIFHAGLSFHEAFEGREKAIQGRQAEIVVTLFLCGFPILLGNAPLMLLPGNAGAMLALVLTSLLALPSLVLLYLYHWNLEVQPDAATI